ncbi:hypothetical protein P5V15_011219 [Pogonomyrmex californicus]
MSTFSKKEKKRKKLIRIDAFLYLAKLHCFLFRLYPGDTSVCETNITSRRSILFFHTSCRLGVALSMLHGVYCFSVVVIVLCSSIRNEPSDAQNVFANEERFQVCACGMHWRV